STDVPFVVTGTGTFQREQLREILREASVQQQKQELVFTITRVTGLEEYTRGADKRERDSLKGLLPGRDVRVAHVPGRPIQGAVETAILIVRVREARAWVIGIGQAAPRK